MFRKLDAQASLQVYALACLSLSGKFHSCPSLSINKLQKFTAYKVAIDLLESTEKEVFMALDCSLDT